MNEESLQQEASSSTDDEAVSRAVWSFRGYQLRPGDFTTSMVHLFRAEVQRSTVWRQRLDHTTNWAVITTGAAISVAFSESIGNHSLIILNTLLVTLFLIIEARRYRYYELWSYRVRLMETDFFAAMLVPPFRPAPDWAESLAETLLHPKFPISVWEALGRRLRRNYMWIYIILGLAWILKLWLHPTPTTSWSQFVEKAAIGSIPGWVVITLGVLFNGALMIIGLLTIGLHDATGEVLPRYADIFAAGLTRNGDQTGQRSVAHRAWYRLSRRRQQVLTFIITDRAEPVAEVILKEMGRGVTALPGTGMYTKQTHSVLFCALTVTEVAELKALVKKTDPHAFVIVTPAQEVLGHGFNPLKQEPAS